jgi:hypothetical protein
MGYTHYWYHTKSFTDNEWTHVIQSFIDILTIATQNGIPLSLEEVVLNTNKAHSALAEIKQEQKRLHADHSLPIFFNGVDEDGHETFVLSKEAPSNQMDFCKTAHKPYDTVVTAFLAFLESQYKDKINVSSDGYPEEWEKGLMLARKSLEENISDPRFFKEEE